MKKPVLNCTIVLMGIKHCGKSTHGKKLADMFGCAFYDTDDEIMAVTGRSPRTIYTEDGPEGFIAAEALACRTLWERIGGEPCVIATGGGICNNPEALTILHGESVMLPAGRRIQSRFVFMEVPEQIPADRIVAEAVPDGQGGYGNLPAYIAKKSPRSEKEIRAFFHTFYVERIARYSLIADRTVILTAGSVEENSRRLIQAVCA